MRRSAVSSLTLIRSIRGLPLPAARYLSVPSAALPEIKLIYFDVPVRLEDARLALKLGGVSFEDLKPSIKEWHVLKPTLSLPFTKGLTLPLMVVEDQVLGHSWSIVRYCCKLAHYEGAPLYPSDPFEAAKVDAVCYAWDDAMQWILCAGAPDKLAARAAKMAEGGSVRRFLSQTEHMLDDGPFGNGGWTVGERLTMADLALFAGLNAFRCGWLDGVRRDYLEEFPRICQLMKKVGSLPAVKEYYRDATGMYEVFALDASWVSTDPASKL